MHTCRLFGKSTFVFVFFKYVSAHKFPQRLLLCFGLNITMCARMTSLHLSSLDWVFRPTEPLLLVVNIWLCCCWVRVVISFHQICHWTMVLSVFSSHATHTYGSATLFFGVTYLTRLWWLLLNNREALWPTNKKYTCNYGLVVLVEYH